MLVSASLELYLAPWGRQAGFEHVAASRLEVGADGTVSGRLAGPNCFGAEKVARLEQLLGPLERHIVYAYGDSRGDRELLMQADYPYFRRMPQGKGP
jgi:HAD superfamily phosphoserine phosphatase-like hydrolase